jgi:predicted nuclease of restriction endonuclease-like RecB superfamily
MLTGDLVRVRNSQGKLRPGFLKHDDKTLERAQDLLDLFQEGLEQGATRQQLEQAVDELIGDDGDVKIVRGLAKVLSDRADFVTEAPIPPAELRERLFSAAASCPSRALADHVYEDLARELGSTPDELRRLLFADRKEEQQISGLRVPSARWLLHRYDVALVQSVLLKTTELRVQLHEASPERLRQLFRHVRFHGLMYRVRALPESGHELILDGPASLLRLSTRYGMALANWFPSLLLQPGAWTLTAKARWTKRRLERTLELTHEQGLVSHYKDTGAYRTRTEDWFVERFEKLDSAWRIVEPQVLDLKGRGVICPSFTFRHSDGRVGHLEIVGFWRKDWLQRRLELLDKYGPGNLVLAVSTKLEGSKAGLGRFAGSVVTFKEVVPAKDVLAGLER